MSYPYDSPSYDMSTIWQSGNYTPENVVKNIRDNYTPINKNSMRNSVGVEIATVQNYVNNKYLGRPTIPVESGFFNYVLIGTGMAYSNSPYYGLTVGSESTNYGDVFFKTHGGNGISFTGDNGNKDRITSVGGTGANLYITCGTVDILLDNDGVDPHVEISNNLNLVGGLQVGGSYTPLNDGEIKARTIGIPESPLESGFLDCALLGTGMAYNNDSTYRLNCKGNSFFLPPGVVSGIKFTGDNGSNNRITSLDKSLVLSANGQAQLTFDEIENSIKGTCQFYSNSIQVGGSYTPLADGSIIANSGRIDTVLRVMEQTVINSGEPYGGYGSYYGLTVGSDTNSAGDVFFKTHAGNGIRFYGDNGSKDRITSVGGTGANLYLTCGVVDILLDNDGVDPHVEISKNLLLVEGFGCNNVTPTGMAAIASGTDAAKIAAILDVLKNNGFMSKT